MSNLAACPSVLGSRAVVERGHETVKTKYLPYLDGLRGLAILGVLADHFKLPLPALFHVGPVCVRFFFVLTGYFITLSLWRLKNTMEFSPGDDFRQIGRFYLGRLARIGPPYYFALMIGALFGIHEVTQNFWWLATFQANNYIVRLGYWPTAISHFWSLAVQEQFYLLWPAVVLTVPRHWFLRCMIGMIFFGLIFRVTCILVGATEVIRWVTLFGCLDSFALGALVAYLREIKVLEKIHALPRVWLRLIPLLATALYFLARLISIMSHESVWLALVESLDALLLAWLLASSILGIKNRYARFLGWRPLVYLGRISYGIYVYHVFIIIIVSPYLIQSGLGEMARVILLFAATVAVSSLSWHYMEAPIMEWKKGLSARPTPAVAYPKSSFA